eukprot:gene10084-11114_t
MNGSHIEKRLVCHGLSFVEFNNTQSVKYTAITTIALAIPMSLIATIGNSLILYTIFTTQRLRTAANLLLATLSTTDLFVGLVALPLYVAVRINDYYDQHVCQLKYAYTFAISLGSGISMLDVALVSIDRLLATSYVSRYRNWHLHGKYMKAVGAIVVTWTTFTVLLSTATITNKTFNKGVIAGSVLCITVIIFSYVRIFVKVRQYQTVFVQAVSDSSSDVINEARKEEIRRAKTILLLILCLLLCYSPKTICIFAVPINEADFESVYYCGRISEILLMLNSVLNPFLYCYRIGDVRTETVRNGKLLFHTITCQ